ncbi:DUF4129 domain-containing protein [Thermococcus sp. ES12]|uniref:DUF4129 domain-containing protein n=1 Tax=Thermococcus sp. ES12 TaxID=1638246 RepID=UPI0014322D96|nr:DUF4129 domain-containing protein [Thermococcus sp. ES12]NJE76695.1 DUF4129 domain-containing protein [Thermococcus sp. ES12]
MSTRVKLLALSGLLFSLMTLMVNYSASTSETSQKSPAHWAGVLMMVLAVVGLLVLIGIFLGWRDPFQRFESRGTGIIVKYLVAIALILGVVSVGRLLGKNSAVKHVSNNSTSLNASGVVNGSVIVHDSSYYNGTQIAPTRHSLPSQYLLYIVLLFAIAVFAYLAVTQYRTYMRRKEREEMKLRAELFDRKLDELGLEMFDNPREAIVGIYKNAVLWLDYLGIPYRESWTHWEHAERVKYMHDAFVELTRLFEKAKYAPEKITWDDAKKALEVYRGMRRGVDEV